METTKTKYLVIKNFGKFYRSQFWRLQKPNSYAKGNTTRFIGHNFGDYKNQCYGKCTGIFVLSVTILETTKTVALSYLFGNLFYRSQFWRLQKRPNLTSHVSFGFIGHNFGDYKNLQYHSTVNQIVLSVTILETTKTTSTC